MKLYIVTKENSGLKMSFNSFSEAKDFCNSFIALENARGAEFPYLHINIEFI